MFGTDRRVVVLALARMADAVGNSFLIIVLPLFIASGRVPLEGIVGGRVLGVALTEELLIGVVLSTFGLLNSLGQPFAGRLSDRTGRRRAFILVGLVLLGVGSGGFALVDSYAAVLALRVLQGVGAALTIPATVALVNELATTETRGGNFGVFNAFRLLGFGLGPLVAGALVQFGPYRLPGGTVLGGFDAAFGGALLGALVSFGLVAGLVSDPERTAAIAGNVPSIDVAGDRSSEAVLALGVATLFMAIGITMFATLEGLINDRLGQGTLLFGVEFAAVIVANVVLQVPIGRASDRYGRRPFIVWGFVVLVPATLAQGYALTPATMTAARLVQGIAVAMVFAPSLALVGDLAGEGQSGSYLSVLTMAFGLGSAVGPLASGWLVAYGFVVPFAVGAGLAVIGLGLVYARVGETVGRRDVVAG